MKSLVLWGGLVCISKEGEQLPIILRGLVPVEFVQAIFQKLKVLR
jgi:hypothetical protein